MQQNRIADYLREKLAAVPIQDFIPND